MEFDNLNSYEKMEVLSVMSEMAEWSLKKAKAKYLKSINHVWSSTVK